MATWDITVSAGSGVGAGATDVLLTTISGVVPGDFDGSTINSVVVQGTPTVTNDDGTKDDTIGIRFFVTTTVPADTFGSDASDAASMCYALLSGASLSANITDGSARSPNPTTAVAADWDEIRYSSNYSASMKDDAETVSWSAFTVRVTYTPNADTEITTNAPQALTLTEQTATLTHNVSITTNTPQALTVTPQTATVVFDVGVTTTAPQALTVTPQTATLTADLNISTNAPQALVVTPQTATLTHPVSITTGTPQALTVTPLTADVAYGVNIVTNAPQALTITPQTASLTHDVSITSGTPQALTITPQTATLVADLNITTGAPQALTVTTLTASVAIGAADVDISVGTQSLTLTPYTASVTYTETAVEQNNAGGDDPFTIRADYSDKYDENEVIELVIKEFLKRVA